MASIKCHCAFINIFDAAKQSERIKKLKHILEATMTHHMYIFTMISMGCSNFSYFDIFFGVCGQTYDKI